MSEGKKAADQTRGVFQQLGDATEGIRKNINSFADELVSGKGSAGSHGSSHPSSGIHGGGGNDIHPDAQKAGNQIQQGVDSAGKKLDEMMDKNKRT